MQRKRSVMFVILLSLTFVRLSGAQISQSTKANGTSKERTELYQTSIVEFTNIGPVPGLPGSPVLVYPTKCNSDGVPFVQILVPPEFREKRLYAITKDGGREFSTEKIPDLHDIRILSYYPSNTALVLLTNAALDANEQNVSITLPNGERRDAVQTMGERKSYIIQFDTKGNYQRRFEVDEAIAPVAAGIFDSGNILLFGVSRSTALPLLAILGPDGKVLSLLDVPKNIQEWSKKLRGERQVSPANLLYLPPSQLVSFQTNILVIPQGSLSVLEISEGGEIKPIQLALPSGVIVDSFIPSNESWYVRVRGADTNSSGDARNAELRVDSGVYKLDPATGDVISRVDTHGVPAESIACVQEGSFVAFRYENGRFVRMIGDVKR